MEICYNLNSGGYDDWFLPSIYELSELYLNHEIIDANPLVIDPFNTEKFLFGSESSHYASSTESDAPEGHFWKYRFCCGGYSTGSDNVYGYYVVRAS